MGACSRIPRPARRARGYSLMEIAIVLAIVALLVASALLFFAGASEKQKLADTETEVVALVGAVHGLYAGQSSYENLDTGLVAQSRLLPAKWTDGGSVKTPFSGFVGINSQGDDKFNVTLYGLDQQACIQLALLDLGGLNTDGEVNDTSFTYGTAFTLNAAMAACSQPGMGNHVGWNFR